MSVARVLGQAWELYKKSFSRFVLTAAVIFAVLEFLAALSESAGHAHHWTAAALWGLVSFLLWIVGTFWLQGALVGAVSDLRGGRAELPIDELYHVLSRSCRH